jgi:sugar lactone lactonase YvrE
LDTNRINRYRGSIAVAVVGLVILAGYAVWQLDPWAEQGTGLASRFQLDLDRQFAVDPNLIHYSLASEFPLALKDVRGIASGPEDRIYVAGDQAIQIFQPDGKIEATVSLGGVPSCLAVAGGSHADPGQMYVAVGGQIHVLDTAGKVVRQWAVPSDAPVLTALAVAPQDLFAADASGRVVWHFTLDGQLVGAIGKPDPERQQPPFIVPSPYFDLVLGAEGLLHVVNPGMRQIMTYSYAGDFGDAWGSAGSQLKDFFGCCNPAHLAILPDGRFVTSEKGIPRIKVYGAQGQFESVVAGPEQLTIHNLQVVDPREDADKRVFDVAVDSQGRVLVLDPQNRSVRVYVARAEQTEGTS